MGEMEVPADALYGASTQRAVLNFPISGTGLPRRFLRALALIKLAAAETNGAARPARPGRRGRDRGRRRRGRRRRPRRPVPDRHLPDRLRDLDQHEHERGRRPPRERPPGRPQPSTRTTTSTAARARTTRSRRRSSCRPRWRSRTSCCPALERLHTALVAKEQEFWPVVKTGRTHLQDATPIRLGQEFRGYAGQVEESLRRARAAQAELLFVPLGGTAVGTGHQRPSRSTRSGPAPGCRSLTGLTVREAANHFHAQATLDAAIAAHGAIRTIALSLWKIASDVRLMGMGPRAGHRRAGPARDPAGLEHHARQGEPGHRREPDDGRRPRRRQRRDGRLRPDRQLPRAQRDAAGDGRRAARVDRAAGRGRRQLQRPLHRGPDGHRPRVRGSSSRA